MTEQNYNLTFDEWVDYIFDRPIDDTWYWETGDDEKPVRWKPGPTTIASYLIRLFEQPAFLVDRFSVDQIDQGFDFICGGISRYLTTALSDPTAKELHVRLIYAIHPLYRDCFARLSPDSPAEDTDDTQVVPRMFVDLWDEDTLCRAGSSRWYTHLVTPILDVLERILQLDSPACQRSALRACWYLRQYHAQRVLAIVEKFRRQHPRLNSEVRARAQEIVAPPATGQCRSLSFDAWVDYVFNHPVEEDSWYLQRDEHGNPLDWWVPTPLVAADYMVRLFENPRVLVGPYSDEQIDQGLWFIMGRLVWGYCSSALEDVVPVEFQRRWVYSIIPLYRELFAERCSEHFGRRTDGPEPARPLNMSCYMFWDMGNLYDVAASIWHRHLVDPVFDVLEQTLSLDSLACRESSLHGLGHVHESHPERVQSVIKRFLKSYPQARPHLRAYAECAAVGAVQ